MESTTQDDQSLELPAKNAETDTEATLIRLSQSVFNLCNVRDFSDPIVKHLASDIRVSHESTTVFNESNLVEHFKGMIVAIPDLHIEVRNMSVWHYQPTGNATVWAFLILSGLPSGMQMESIGGLCWELRDGFWTCTRHMGLRWVSGV